MKIEKMGMDKPSNISEGVLFESISKYIDKSKFPKNLMLRKLTLVEQQLNKSNDNINKLIEETEKTIQGIIRKSDTLNTSCNKLLYKLRMDFSYND